MKGCTVCSVLKHFILVHQSGSLADEIPRGAEPSPGIFFIKKFDRFTILALFGVHSLRKAFGSIFRTESNTAQHDTALS
jgi:hypothetical protein